MAILKYKTKDGQWKSIVNYTIAPLTPVQVTGTSTSDVMSQDAVTKQLALKANTTVVDDLSNKVDNINEQMSATTGSFIVTNQNIENVLASSSTITDIKGDIDDINGYTVNSKPISGSPILNGADIKLDGYTVSELTNEELQLSTADTVNVAFGKIAKAMNDNEHIISEAMNTFNSSCGFNENGKPNFTEDSLSAYTNILDAVDYLGGYVNYMNGHNEVTTLQGVPNDKRVCLATLNENDAFTVSSSNLKDGRELHIIVHNTSSNTITVSMPSTATYVNLSGELLTIEANKYAEINVVAIGIYKYVRYAN